MCGNPELGNLMHAPCPDLNFKRVALRSNDGCMQRLVRIRLRDRNVVLDPSGNRGPTLVNQAKRGITFSNRVDNDPESEKIENIGHVDTLPLKLLEN